jgi:hypothetical protein
VARVTAAVAVGLWGAQVKKSSDRAVRLEGADASCADLATLEPMQALALRLDGSPVSSGGRRVNLVQVISIVISRFRWFCRAR